MVYNKANKVFNKDGIPVPMEQLPVLMTLFYNGTISQQEIADFLARDKSSVLRSLKSLETKKLIHVAQDPFDGRKKMIQLTKEGQKIGEHINDKIVEIDKMVFSCLTNEEKQLFENLLIKCTEGVSRL